MTKPPVREERIDGSVGACPELEEASPRRLASIQKAVEAYAGSEARNVIVLSASVINDDGAAIVATSGPDGQHRMTLVISRQEGGEHSPDSESPPPEIPVGSASMRPVPKIGWMAAEDLESTECWLMGIVADRDENGVVVQIDRPTGLALSSTAVQPGEARFVPLPIGSAVSIESGDETLLRIAPKA